MYNVKVSPRRVDGEHTLVTIKSLDTLKHSTQEEGTFLILENSEDSFIAVMRHEVMSVQAVKVSEVALEPHPTVCIDQYVADPAVKAQVDAAYNATGSFKEEEKILEAFIADNPDLENTILNPQGC